MIDRNNNNLLKTPKDEERKFLKNITCLLKTIPFAKDIVYTKPISDSITFITIIFKTIGAKSPEAYNEKQLNPPPAFQSCSDFHLILRLHG